MADFDLLKGKTLRNQIGKMLTTNRLGIISSILRKSQKRSRFANHSHQTFTQVDSPNIKTQFSQSKLSQSPLVPKYKSSVVYRSNSDSRSKGKRNPGKETKRKQKNKLSQIEDRVPRSKFLYQAIARFENRRSCSNKQLGLSSIVERSSSSQGQLVTPKGIGLKKTKRSPVKGSSTQKTKKRDKKYLDLKTKRRMVISLRQGERFQRLMHGKQISVRYRVTRNRIIEIQLQIHEPIEFLDVRIQGGNIQCQNVIEKHQNLTQGQILTFITAVRSIIFSEPTFKFPRLVFDIGGIKEQIIIPYTWLNFAEKGHSKKNKSPQKSRIRTKICFDGLGIEKRWVKELCGIFGGKEKKTGYELRCWIEQQQILVTIWQAQAGKGWSLQVEGRGEQKLTKMVELLSQFLV